jgi:hypothetical protein
LKPEALSVEQRATEYVHWYNYFARMGITPRFSDEPPAVIWLPITMASGPAEVAACRKLGRDLIAFADEQERLLGGTVMTTSPPPPMRSPVPAQAVPDDRVSVLMSQVAQLTAMLKERESGGEPAPYQFTTPTPGEHPVVPVAPR